ncbi:tumor necrosis factor ligand superfamily member 15-like isoform X1 [Alosa sapidissima]|uniref:tumor necrosis factor ligand superfamily member 15-like isoform X1 n=1 Tax=Alosa sapidissima TaxID=34773 RepID=UPI001C084DC1|nr:tumor necrosis factor ligand superfamily member 15-like isoform X1 [Alosa sapidissima]
MDGRVDMELAYNRQAPSRSEINCKLCISITASVVISTFTCTLVVFHILGKQPTVSPAKEATGYQKLQGGLTQKTKPHAHLGADPTGKKNGFLSWRNRSKDDLNMEYNHSEQSLVIPENGFYVIYLQISYRGIKKSCEKNVLLMHDVIKRSPRYNNEPRTVISSLETVPRNVCGEEWRKTTHSTARIFLYKEDSLKVNLISNHSLVDMYGTYGTKTFWGVYLDRDLN